MYFLYEESCKFRRSDLSWVLLPSYRSACSCNQNQHRLFLQQTKSMLPGQFQRVRRLLAAEWFALWKYPIFLPVCFCQTSFLSLRPDYRKYHLKNNACCSDCAADRISHRSYRKLYSALLAVPELHCPACPVPELPAILWWYHAVQWMLLLVQTDCCLSHKPCGRHSLFSWRISDRFVQRNCNYADQMESLLRFRQQIWRIPLLFSLNWFQRRVCQPHPAKRISNQIRPLQ